VVRGFYLRHFSGGVKRRNGSHGSQSC
jgi:hypothetical protein